MGDLLPLKCPTCSVSRDVPRHPGTDPDEAVVVLLKCAKCNGGQSDEPVYLGADGKELGGVDAHG